MQPHPNAILKTARAVAFVIAAVALYVTGASAQDAGANETRPAKPAVRVEVRPASPPASPPSVAPGYAASSPRPLPSVERVGADVGDSHSLTAKLLVHRDGMMGILMVLVSSLVAAASTVAEKESGTVEKLLMTPAGSAEFICAKIAPILLLLSADIVLAVVFGRLFFGIPVRGSLLLLYFGGMLCALSGIGIGTFIATFTRSQTQAQLVSFFVNPPIAMLAGATTPGYTSSVSARGKGGPPPRAFWKPSWSVRRYSGVHTDATL